MESLFNKVTGHHEKHLQIVASIALGQLNEWLKNVKLYLSSRELWFTIIFLKQYSRQKGTNSTQRDNYGISALYNSFPEKIREIQRRTDTCDETIFLNPKLPLKKPLWW